MTGITGGKQDQLGALAERKVGLHTGHRSNCVPYSAKIVEDTMILDRF